MSEKQFKTQVFTLHYYTAPANKRLTFQMLFFGEGGAEGTHHSSLTAAGVKAALPGLRMRRHPLADGRGAGV